MIILHSWFVVISRSIYAPNLCTCHLQLQYKCIYDMNNISLQGCVSIPCPFSSSSWSLQWVSVVHSVGLVGAVFQHCCPPPGEGMSSNSGDMHPAHGSSSMLGDHTLTDIQTVKMSIQTYHCMGYPYNDTVISLKFLFPTNFPIHIMYVPLTKILYTLQLVHSLMVNAYKN